MDDIIDRLAAYEDTELEPEEIERLKLASIGKAIAEITEFNGVAIDRLRELAQADKERRCVVLPCSNWFDIVFWRAGGIFGIDTDYDENPIREITVHNEERFTWYDGWKTLVLNRTDENKLDWEFSPEEIGKTVFLTREEAEAALEAQKGAEHE
jgi:hypothetical protein